ncbi:MAG: glycosyltransferase family 4 protein [Clostridia bacterium]|nr:glycosyltransferase family 4 protein [Clostridia bacterium]
MNVCFLLGSLHRNGGIGRVAISLANSLCKDSGINVHMLCYSSREKGVFYSIDPDVKLDYLLEQHCNMKKALLKGTHRKLREYIKKNNIDVLVVCGVIYYLISVLAIKKTKAKCLCWEHCNSMTTSDIAFEGIYRKIGAKKADLVVTLTKRDKLEYQKQYKGVKVDQVYNSVDPKILENVKPYNPDTKKIISVGRLTYQKYFEKAVEVAALVLPKFPDHTWHIYGGGEKKEDLQNQINAAGLNGRLILEGQVNNIYDLYSEHSLLVMTSRYEGFPMVLLEGLGKNLPLVAFDIFTGPNEIIHNGENGYLVEPFDTEGMAEKICEILNDRDLRIKMSQNCKNYVGEFEHSAIVDRWKEIFKNLANS